MAFIDPIETAVEKRTEHRKQGPEKLTAICFMVPLKAFPDWLSIATARLYWPNMAEPLTEQAFAELEEWARHHGFILVWNDRSKRGDVHYKNGIQLPESVIGKELGLSYDVRPRHGGIDPLLFLDFRAARRWVKNNAKGKTVLNLFAYTCGIGVAAIAGKAAQVLNVDFAKRSLAVGRENALFNGIGKKRFKIVHDDALCILRQSPGLGVKGVLHAGALPVENPNSSTWLFSIPSPAKSPFGKVDVNDYQSLIDPLCCANQGPPATNNVSRRCKRVAPARCAGRESRSAHPKRTGLHQKKTFQALMVSIH